MKRLGKFSAMAAAAALALTGCGGGLVGGDAKTAPLTDLSTEQILTLLPTEDELRGALDTSSPFFRITNGPGESAMASLDDMKPCDAAGAPRLLGPGNIMGESSVGLYSPNKNTEDKFEPRMNVSILELSSEEKVNEFIGTLDEAANRCSSDKPEWVTVSNKRSGPGDKSLYISLQASNDSSSIGYSYTAIGRRMLQVIIGSYDMKDHLGQTEESTKAIYEKLEGEPSAEGLPIVPLAVAAEPTQSRPPLKIGVSADRPGLSVLNGEEATGFEPDIARLIARELGYAEDEIQWVSVQPANRETSLQNQVVDLILANYGITDNRRQMVDFAGPYYVSAVDLLIRTTDVGKLSVANMKSKKLCSVAGSTTAQKLSDRILPGVELVETLTLEECATKLDNGDIDAIPGDNNVLAGIASEPQHDGKFVLMAERLDETSVGVGVQKGGSMCSGVTDALNNIVRSGEWSAALRKNLPLLPPSGFAEPPIDPCF